MCAQVMVYLGAVLHAVYIAKNVQDFPGFNIILILTNHSIGSTF